MRGKLEDSFCELYAYMYSQREIYGDKLSVLKMEAKSLYIPNNKIRATELQLEIQATQNYIEKLNDYIKTLSDKYKQIAMSLNSIDMEIFVDIYFNAFDINSIADKYHLQYQTVVNKKTVWNRLIKSKLKNKVILPSFARDGIKPCKIQK